MNFHVIGVSGKLLSRVMFDKYDPDKSGYIDLKEFQAMLRDHGMFLDGDALEIAFSEVDADGSQRISYEEFMQWKKSSSFSDLAIDDETLERRQSFLELFKRHDVNKDGRMHVSEFPALYEELKEFDLIKKPLAQVMADMDDNRGDDIIIQCVKHILLYGLIRNVFKHHTHHHHHYRNHHHRRHSHRHQYHHHYHQISSLLRLDGVVQFNELVRWMENEFRKVGYL